MPVPSRRNFLARSERERRAEHAKPTVREQAELDHFMEHILRMAKARARQILSRGQ